MLSTAELTCRCLTLTALSLTTNTEKVVSTIDLSLVVHCSERRLTDLQPGNSDWSTPSRSGNWNTAKYIRTGQKTYSIGRPRSLLIVTDLIKRAGGTLWRHFGNSSTFTGGIALEQRRCTRRGKWENICVKRKRETRTEGKRKKSKRTEKHRRWKKGKSLTRKRECWKISMYFVEVFKMWSTIES